MPDHKEALRADLVFKLELFHAVSTMKEIINEEYTSGNLELVEMEVHALLERLELAKRRWFESRFKQLARESVGKGL